jgi:hypothetical protein
MLPGTRRKQPEAALRGRAASTASSAPATWKPKPLTFRDDARGSFEQGEKTAGWKANTVSVYRKAIQRAP